MNKKTLYRGFGLVVISALLVGVLTKKDSLRFDDHGHITGSRSNKVMPWNPNANPLSQTEVKTPEANATTLSKEQLSALANDVEAALPTLADLKHLSSEDVHMVAKPIFVGSLQLKRYADQLELAMKATEAGSAEFKELAAEGAQFYGTCASGEQTPESIRAVCYVGFLKMATASNHPESVAQLHMPSDVLRIALAIAK